MPVTYLRRAAIGLALLVVAGCTVKSTEAPPLAGPSGLALTLQVNANPDSISQDGGSQSSIKVTAIGPDGKGIPSLPIRVDMMVGGVPQDFGTLSARSIVTNGDGVASVIYTAPPSSPGGNTGFCGGLPGTCVGIIATASASNFDTANPQSAQIRLVPPGVIQPPASSPTARFTISPTPVNFNIASTFDASTSSAGSGATAITSYSWTFGDGSTGSGKTVSHTFTQSTSPGNAYNVTLTVTNDRGLSNSTTQAISVDASPAPTGDWVYSPTSPQIGDTVFFNADAVKPAAGHKLVQFSWNFGDGSSGSGFQTTHAFAQGGTYTVVLSVLDDADQKLVLSKTVLVAGGNPTPVLTVTKTGALAVRADGSVSAASGGATITSYTFFWGDGTSDSGTSPTQSHNYAATTGAGTYPVTLRVTDSLGRTTTSSPTSVTVP